MRLLQSYPWPGNVRELRNLMRRAVLQAQQVMIREEDIQPLLAKSPESGPVEPIAERAVAPNNAAVRSLREVASGAVAAAEREAIAGALRAAAGNKSAAARMLKIDYKTLFAKLRRYEM